MDKPIELLNPDLEQAKEIAYQQGYQDAVKDMTECKNNSCYDCKLYDKEKHNCPIWCKVIHDTIDDVNHIEREETVDECLEIIHEYFYQFMMNNIDWGTRTTALSELYSQIRKLKE